MIKKYLENYRQEMLERKFDLEKDYQKNELYIKENLGFIQMLERNEDKSYNSFSPKISIQDNSEKIKSLRLQQRKLEENRNNLNLELANLNQKVDELSSIIKVAKENEKNHKTLEKQMDDQEIYRLKLLETQEFERQRIARDLHDSTVQRLTSFVHKIELCSKLVDMDKVRCKLELQTMSKNVRETIEDMRRVIYDLRPMSLDDMGIDVTIERELSRIKKSSMINISYMAKGHTEGILPVVSLTMLRIIQEACNNTIKHANAKNVIIRINYEKDWINLSIEDDGKGFDASRIQHESSGFESGFGISVMNERVYLLSGNIEIDSQLDRGTRIHVKIPRKKEEEECQ